MDGNTERIQTVVIGGGQAGLAVGYHLARANRPFVILDAHERVGDAWRKRWDSLRVFSPARLDGLPGRPFPIIRLVLPHQRRDGGLLRGLRRDVRPSGTYGSPRDAGVEVRPRIRRGVGSWAVRGRPCRHRVRPRAHATYPGLRARPRSEDPAAALQRVSAAVAADRTDARGRRRQLGGRDRHGPLANAPHVACRGDGFTAHRSVHHVLRISRR